jgi:NitT/TauT family transport system substrate-binding protein
MARTKLLVMVIAAVIVALMVAGCTTTPQQNGTKTNNTTAGSTQVGLLYSGGVGPMPNLLAMNQIDGYIAWQPFVQIGLDAKIAKLVSLSQNFPPNGSWSDHPCCVVTARDDLIAAHPDFVNTMGALTILGDQYITDHQDESADIMADWLAGRGNLTYGNVSVSSGSAVNGAIKNVKYTTTPSDSWKNGTRQFVTAQKSLGLLSGKLNNATPDQVDSLLFNFGPYQNATTMINQNKFVTPAKIDGQIGVGYLKGDMHSAGLLVAIKKWQYMSDTYGIALKPQDPTQSKPEVCDLIVNGQKVAEVKLVSADAGPQLMQLEGTSSVQMGYAGVPPAIGAIDTGMPIKVLMPINTEGSGLVAAASSPAGDWNSFIGWAQQRSAAGNPLKIAVPSKGSIQDVMLRFALKDSGVVVKEV